MVRFTSARALVLGATLLLGACGRHDDAATTGAANASNGVEEMGAMGGGNSTTTATDPGARPVGTADNGNVMPGNANPEKPRQGMDAGVGNTQ